MKVVKDPAHGLLLNYFGLDGRFYLSVTIMTFFDFGNPDQPLKEQELWPFVQGELGKETVFDPAMPKPKGEALVWGRCFASHGRPVPASQVHFRLGPIDRTLYVFGDRFWKRTITGMTITDPVPFVEMPVAYELAFGGAGYEGNPLGRGMGVVRTASGDEVYPLPNIEDPRCLIASPSDRPEPAGFGPLDATLPRRSKKLGTYDGKWLEERWPFYPEDMDWTYFNAAPEDQQMEIFFRGDEKFSITNMHREKPVIESRLPSLRLRLFAEQAMDVDKPEGERIFREIHTHIDTVWLFPHKERGVVIHRGSVKTADDEALDVLHLFVATEDPSREAKSLEEFREELKKRLDRKTPEVAVVAMAKAREKLADAAERLKDLPREITDSVAAGLGLMPSPPRTHEETIALLTGLIDEQSALVDAGEAKISAAKKKLGHVTKIDATGFQRIRQGLAAVRQELTSMPAMIAEATADGAAARKEASAVFRKAMEKIDPALLKEKGIDPDIKFDPSPPAPDQLWHERGMRFIERCRDELASRTVYMNVLMNTGLRRYTIRRAWLGFRPVPGTDNPALWGLPDEDKERRIPREVALPPGLAVPCFSGAKLHRIRMASLYDVYPPPDIPRLSFKAMRKMARDIMVEGSDQLAMVQGAEEGKPFVRVAYEVEAILLDQEAGDFCAVVAMGDEKVKLDEETQGLLRKAPQFLVLQYPDSEERADKDIEVWKGLHPEAEPLLMPGLVTLLEAKGKGVDLRKWLAEALRPGIAPEEENLKEVDFSKPGALAALVPAIDAAALIRKARETIMAGIQPELDLMEKEKKEVMEAAVKTLKAKGLPTDEFFKPMETSAAEEANPFASMKEQYARQFSETRAHLKKKGLLTPEMNGQISEAEKASSDLLTKAAARCEEGNARLAAAERTFAGGPPDWARKLLSDAGIDPGENGAGLTREKVVEIHGKSLSLAGKNLAGLDLSGLDLGRADMRRANLKKAHLGNSILDGADMTGAIANGADFTHASLVKASMTKGLFQGAKFSGADLSGSDLAGAVMKETDLQGSTMRGARLEKTIFEKANLKGACLSGVRAAHAHFLSADATEADFSNADLTNAMFLKTAIEKASFTGAVLRSALIVETKGKGVNFTGGDLRNSRIFNGSAMTESTFTNVRADQSCWMKSDLSGSDFRGMVITRGLIQECRLAGSNLSGVSAKETRITKTDLSDANLEKTNLFQGSLRKSKLVRTDLRKANLYSVEFFRTGVGETRLEGANLKMTKLYKRTDLLPKKKE